MTQMARHFPVRSRAGLPLPLVQAFSAQSTIGTAAFLKRPFFWGGFAVRPAQCVAERNVETSTHRAKEMQCSSLQPCRLLLNLLLAIVVLILQLLRNFLEELGLENA